MPRALLEKISLWFAIVVSGVLTVAVRAVDFVDDVLAGNMA